MLALALQGRALYLGAHYTDHAFRARRCLDQVLLLLWPSTVLSLKHSHVLPLPHNREA